MVADGTTSSLILLHHFQTKQKIATLQATKRELAREDFSLELSNKVLPESIHAKKKNLHLTFLNQSFSSSVSSLSDVSPHSVATVFTCLDGGFLRCQNSLSDLDRGNNDNCSDDVTSNSTLCTHSAAGDIKSGSDEVCAAVASCEGAQIMMSDSKTLLSDTPSCMTAVTPEFILFDVEALIRESRKRCRLPELDPALRTHAILTKDTDSAAVSSEQNTT